MQILVATLRGAVHQQQRAAAYAALLPSLLAASCLVTGILETLAHIICHSKTDLAIDCDRNNEMFYNFIMS